MEGSCPKGKYFPPCTSGYLCFLPPTCEEAERLFFQRFSFPAGSGAEVNGTLMGIFVKARQTLNRGASSKKMSHYHVVQLFNLTNRVYSDRHVTVMRFNGRNESVVGTYQTDGGGSRETGAPGDRLSNVTPSTKRLFKKIVQ